MRQVHEVGVGRLRNEVVEFCVLHAKAFFYLRRIAFFDNLEASTFSSLKLLIPCLIKSDIATGRTALDILDKMLFSWLAAQRAARRRWLRSGQPRFLVMMKAVEC